MEKFIANSENFEAFCYQLTVRQSHLDAFGHVNNAKYLEILEEARWNFIQSRGFDAAYIKDNNLGPVILECHLYFLKELTIDELITIDSCALNYKGKVGQLQQTIINQNQEICFKAEMSFGLFDTLKRKLVLPTPAWLYAIGFKA